MASEINRAFSRRFFGLQNGSAIDSKGSPIDTKPHWRANFAGGRFAYFGLFTPYFRLQPAPEAHFRPSPTKNSRELDKIGTKKPRNTPNRPDCCQATIILRRQRQLESPMTMGVFLPHGLLLLSVAKQQQPMRTSRNARLLFTATSGPPPVPHWLPLRPWPSSPAPPDSSTGLTPGSRCDAPGGRSPPPWSSHP